MTLQLKLMRGAYPVRMAIARYLAEALPIARTRAVADWDDITAETLPKFKLIDPFDAVATDQSTSPIIGIDVSRSTSYTRTDVLYMAQEEYNVRFTVRLNIWCYGDQDAEGQSEGAQRASATRKRDDLIALVVAVVLDRPSMNTGELLNTDEETVVVDYHTVAPVPNTSQRYYAGGQITFDTVVQEYQARDALNDPTKPNTFDVEVEAISIAEPYNQNLGLYPRPQLDRKLPDWRRHGAAGVQPR